MRGLCARVYLVHAALYLGGDILYPLLLRVLEIGIYLGDDAVVFAVNHDLVNYIQFFELLLNRLGRDVFAARKDYQILDSAGDEQLPVLGDIADVALNQPSSVNICAVSSGIL